MVKFIILLIMVNNLFAITLHQAKYKLFYNGFEIGTEERILTQKNNTYIYQANAKTEGLARWFKDYKIKAKSIFILNDKISSKKFDSIEYDGTTVKKQIHLIFDNNQVKGKEKIWQIKNGAVDFLSLFLAISEDFKNNKSFNYSFADGKKIKNYTFVNQGKKQITIANEEIEVIKIAGKNIVVYLAKKYDYLPVLIQKKNFKYELKYYKKVMI